MKTLRNLILLASLLFAGSLFAQTSATASLGQSVTMTASVASGTTPFTYQWKKDGVNIPDAVNGRWYIPAMKAADVGVYTVEVRNSAGQTVSAPLSLSLAIEIVPPANATINVILGPKPVANTAN